MDLDKANVIPVIGDVDSGKTSVCFHFLKNYKGKKNIVLYNYPNKSYPYKYIDTLFELGKVENSIIFIDEFQLSFPIYSNRTASMLLFDLLAFVKHNKNTLILTTQNSQNLPKQVENFCDGYILTHIEHLKLVKNVGLIKEVVNNIYSSYRVNKISNCLNINKGEYYQQLINQDDNGFQTFINPNVKKDWCHSSKDEYRELKIKVN